jgi:hypothetical protein
MAAPVETAGQRTSHTPARACPCCLQGLESKVQLLAEQLAALQAEWHAEKEAFGAERRQWRAEMEAFSTERRQWRDERQVLEEEVGRLKTMARRLARVQLAEEALDEEEDECPQQGVRAGPELSARQLDCPASAPTSTGLLPPPPPPPPRLSPLGVRPARAPAWACCGIAVLRVHQVSFGSTLDPQDMAGLAEPGSAAQTDAAEAEAAEEGAGEVAGFGSPVSVTQSVGGGGGGECAETPVAGQVIHGPAARAAHHWAGSGCAGERTSLGGEAGGLHVRARCRRQRGSAAASPPSGSRAPLPLTWAAHFGLQEGLAARQLAELEATPMTAMDEDLDAEIADLTDFFAQPELVEVRAGGQAGWVAGMSNTAHGHPKPCTAGNPCLAAVCSLHVGSWGMKPAPLAGCAAGEGRRGRTASDGGGSPDSRGLREARRLPAERHGRCPVLAGTPRRCHRSRSSNAAVSQQPRRAARQQRPGGRCGGACC